MSDSQPLPSYDVLLQESDARAAIVRTPEDFDLLPGNIDLTAAEIQLMEVAGREQRLKTALDPLRPDYDFILIDCPPALSLLTLNARTAADSVLVPMQCEYYALEGLSALIETIEALKARLNPALEIEGVLRTMFDVRNNLANAVSAELITHFGDKVFRTIVPRNVRLAEAPSHGQSIVGYDRSSRKPKRHHLPGRARQLVGPASEHAPGDDRDCQQLQRHVGPNSLRAASNHEAQAQVNGDDGQSQRNVGHRATFPSCKAVRVASAELGAS